MFCGTIIGAFYAIAQALPGGPPGFSEGVQRGQFFHGFWTWFVLAASILGRRQNPDDSPTGSHTFFWVLMILLDTLFTVACYGYGYAPQDDPWEKAQSLMGMGVATGGLMCAQLVYVAFIYVQTKVARRADYMVLAETEEGNTDTDILAVENWLITHSRAGILTNVTIPWKYILQFIRLAIVVWTVWVVGLFVFVLIRDRIMQPCGIRWETGERDMAVCA